MTFKTKIEQACDMIRRAIVDGIPRGVVLADAFYGDEPSFRAAIRSQELDYAVGIKSDNRVWKLDRRGRRCGEPLTVAQLARSLKPKASRRITWRQGVRAPLTGHFAMQRVIPAYRSPGEDLTQRESVWLIIEQPDGEPETKFSFASLPINWSKKRMIRLLKQRWRTERVYQDLKGELGLDHYEGRRYSGWHHHVSVALACYAFVVAERSRLFSLRPEGRKPTVRSRARPERHFDDSFITMRLAIARQISHWLPRCPACHRRNLTGRGHSPLTQRSTRRYG